MVVHARGCLEKGASFDREGARVCPLEAGGERRIPGVEALEFGQVRHGRRDGARFTGRT